MKGGKPFDVTVIWVFRKLRKQVNKNILYEKVGGNRFCRQIVYWCKKQGNKFYQQRKCNSPIFSTETAYALVEVC